jgi:hypothetical protein
MGSPAWDRLTPEQQAKIGAFIDARPARHARFLQKIQTLQTGYKNGRMTWGTSTTTENGESA